jgi:hypothetical protein
MHHRPNAHATISGNSSRQNAPPCDPARSFMRSSKRNPEFRACHRLKIYLRQTLRLSCFSSLDLSPFLLPADRFLGVIHSLETSEQKCHV